MSKDATLPPGRALIVGLGNPGDKYAHTRHNIGVDVAVELARRAGTSIADNKFRALIGAGNVGGRSVSFLLPQTYMNLSGESVSAAMAFWKLTPDAIVALHDDIDLPMATVKLKQGGGHGGHNGLRSMDAQLPSNNYFRVRLGVGRPPHPNADVAGWVLSRFGSAQAADYERLVSTGADAVEVLLSQGLLAAQGRFHPK